MIKYLIVDLTKKERDRIFSKISIDPKTECWLWNGSLDFCGYGLVWYRKRTERIHRVLYAFFVHPIPRGIKETRFCQLDHKCNNTSCCNPNHLELTCQRNNVLRGNGPSAINFRKTHCKYGHKLPEYNNRQNRWRCCPTCDSIRHKLRIQGPNRKYWLKKASEATKRYYKKHLRKN